MKWKEFLNDYFTFTRKERIGLLIIVVVIVVIWIFPKVIASGKSRTLPIDTSWITAAKKLEHKETSLETNTNQNEENINEFVYAKTTDQHSNKLKGELFYFDPNTLTFDGWKRLGLREKTITIIQNYLNKGGHFFKPEDLKKIYGIHANEYQRLESYIKIETPKGLNSDYIKPGFKREQLSNNNSKYSLVDINNADTSAFIALPGIGSKLALRIINFREKLGGFYSIDQIGETYGLSDSSFQKIKPFLKLENASVKKININTATKDEMKLHPYIKWNLANAIVEYRNQHGTFSSQNDLKKITLITEEVFAKIKPYILVE
ncbi:MAG TPA: helix-hairpin-helix domain-containing protein [Chitinophagaceae bacterium]|jgi:competence ComEA-like helix-hairpin-helix protein|nr:helix-hairpin-helix domain-containing protein [Chitinophagaceae bacterium]